MTFLTMSLDPKTTDMELKMEGARTTSFISFERAISETNQLAGITQTVKGYEVTHQGITIIWE